ncbi:MAG TPA: SPOR domain-containing protein [Thermodesulfovibrionales bacterium]|jgi:cell division septation protein DedD|nr:SPOR domain-containing protein [Thermodesulfovibrionales bacterium]
MKQVDFKKHSSIFYIGKGLIIASIVLAASLGFLLGFFVGKQVQPLTETQATGFVSPEGSQQSSQETQVKESLQQQPETPQLPATEKNNQSPKDQQAGEPRATQSVQKPQGNLRNTDVSSSEKHRDQPQPTRALETKQPKETKPKQSSPEPKDTKVAQDKLKTQKTTLTRKYTVQAGAFKNPEEADALKTKMSKKGYKSFVTTAKTKKQETLHKVMVGEFRNRKEAEVLSIKLKNSEGLRTFVTFVMQESATRQQ